MSRIAFVALFFARKIAAQSCAPQPLVFYELLAPANTPSAFQGFANDWQAHTNAENDTFISSSTTLSVDLVNRTLIVEKNETSNNFASIALFPSRIKSAMFRNTTRSAIEHPEWFARSEQYFTYDGIHIRIGFDHNKQKAFVVDFEVLFDDSDTSTTNVAVLSRCRDYNESSLEALVATFGSSRAESDDSVRWSRMAHTHVVFAPRRWYRVRLSFVSNNFELVIRAAVFDAIDRELLAASTDIFLPLPSNFDLRGFFYSWYVNPDIGVGLASTARRTHFRRIQLRDYDSLSPIDAFDLRNDACDPVLTSTTTTTSSSTSSTITATSASSDTGTSISASSTTTTTSIRGDEMTHTTTTTDDDDVAIASGAFAGAFAFVACSLITAMAVCAWRRRRRRVVVVADVEMQRQRSQSSSVSRSRHGSQSRVRSRSPPTSTSSASTSSITGIYASPVDVVRAQPTGYEAPTKALVAARH